jgi:hypothetical protein
MEEGMLWSGCDGPWAVARGKDINIKAKAKKRNRHLDLEVAKKSIETSKKLRGRDDGRGYIIRTCLV